MSCSDKMRGLVTDLENSVWDCGCGYEAHKYKGSVTLSTLSKPIIRRMELLREIEILENRADWWGTARSHNSLSGQ